jgi:hypothetical protein
MRDSRIATQEQLSDHVMQAAFAWIARTLVYFSPGPPSGRPTSVSSGTPFRTPAGRVVLLTAAHCVEDIDDNPHSLGYFGREGAIADALQEVVKAPGNVDVALVTVSLAAQIELLAFALDTSLVPLDADVAANQWCVIGGFPWDVLQEQPGNGVRYMRFGSVTHGTSFEGRDPRGRLRVSWDEADVRAVDPGIGERFGVTDGQRFKLPRPHGISGGALWRFTGETPQDVVWSPARRAALIGVPSAFLPESRIELAEPADAWGAWFHEQVALVDARSP